MLQTPAHSHARTHTHTATHGKLGVPAYKVDLV